MGTSDWTPSGPMRAPLAAALAKHAACASPVHAPCTWHIPTHPPAPPPQDFDVFVIPEQPSKFPLWYLDGWWGNILSFLYDGGAFVLAPDSSRADASFLGEPGGVSRQPVVSQAIACKEQKTKTMCTRKCCGPVGTLCLGEFRQGRGAAGVWVRDRGRRAPGPVAAGWGEGAEGTDGEGAAGKRGTSLGW